MRAYKVTCFNVCIFQRSPDFQVHGFHTQVPLQVAVPDRENQDRRPLPHPVAGLLHVNNDVLIRFLYYISRHIVTTKYGTLATDA